MTQKHDKTLNTEKKFVTFMHSDGEFDRIQTDLDNGWAVVNLATNGRYYAGMLEKVSNKSDTIIRFPGKPRL